MAKGLNELQEDHTVGGYIAPVGNRPLPRSWPVVQSGLVVLHLPYTPVHGYASLAARLVWRAPRVG